MLELSKVFIYFLVQQAAVVLFSLARSKALAAYTGVGGFGLISQANSLVLTFQVILGAGLGSGFVKLIAEHAEKGDTQRRSQVASAVFAVGSLLGITGVLIAALFSRTISTWVFSSPDYAGYVLISVFTAFIVFQYMFFLNLFRGLLEWKIYTLVSILSTAVSLIVTFALIAFFNIDGGVWALLASQVGSLLVAGCFFWFNIRKRHAVIFWGGIHSRKVLRLLLANIGPLLIIQIFTSLSSLATRSMVISTLGLAQNGLVQLSTGISDSYMGLIFALLLSYILPKIAATIAKDPQGARQTQNDGLRFCLLIITPFLVVLLATREIWIPLLYSRAFLAAQGILIWQFLGDFFLVIRRCLNIDLVPTRRFGYLSLDGSLFAAGMIALSVMLLPVIGVYAVSVTSLILNFSLTVFSLLFHQRSTDFRLNQASRTVLVKSFVLLCAGFAAAIWIPGLLTRALAVSLVLVLMLVLLPKTGELQKIWREVLPGIIRQGQLNLREEIDSTTDVSSMD